MNLFHSPSGEGERNAREECKGGKKRDDLKSPRGVRNMNLLRIQQYNG